LSLKVRLVRAGEPAGLLTVKVSVDVPPAPIVVGANALASDGTGCTVRLEAVTLLVMPATPLMLAALLVYGPPITLEVTFTVIAHEAWPLLNAALVTVIELPPPAAATTPTPDGQVVVTAGVAWTSTLAGSVSVKLMPDCGGLPAPLVRVKVSVDMPPTSIAVGTNALFNVACTTVSVWLVTPLVRPRPVGTLAAPFT
jgi:hypothetical protein